MSIVTLNPERVYAPNAVDDLGALIEMIVVLSRAYEESATKSERLQSAWRNKRARAGTEKLSRIAPNWLRLSEDRKRFGIIPERVKVVRRVFRMAADGMGAVAIAKKLNAKGVPVFGRGQHWHASYIRKLLHNRAVLGECQFHVMKDGKRAPVGEPIRDYYPAVIEEHEFYAAGKGIEERKGRGGRHGRTITNLFTGLLKDARDGSNLVVIDKGAKGRSVRRLALVSSAAKAGKPGATYISFSYPHFEQSLLAWGHDLRLGDVLPKKATNIEEELRKAEGKAADLDQRIQTIQSRVATAGNLEALLDALVELEAKRTEAHEKVERLKRELTAQAGEAVDRTRELIERLRSATQPEAYSLRLKLRSTLKRLIRDIVVLAIQVNGDRVALADIELRNGKRRQVVIMPGKLVTLPDGIQDRSIREWQQWPADLRKTRFTALTDEVRRMMELEDAGHARTEIAEAMGVSKSHVSKALLSQGRRMQGRKPADSERLMTWHPQPVRQTRPLTLVVAYPFSESSRRQIALSVPRTCGLWLVASKNLWLGRNSQKSSRMRRAVIVSPPVLSLTAASAKRHPLPPLCAFRQNLPAPTPPHRTQPYRSLRQTGATGSLRSRFHGRHV